MSNISLRGAIATVLVFALAAPAGAARPDAYRMTCSQANGLVADLGAVVMSTSPTTYDRFVANRGYCPLGERPKRAWTATADTPQCRLGFFCVPGRFRFATGGFD